MPARRHNGRRKSARERARVCVAGGDAADPETWARRCSIDEWVIQLLKFPAFESPCASTTLPQDVSSRVESGRRAGTGVRKCARGDPCTVGRWVSVCWCVCVVVVVVVVVEEEAAWYTESPSSRPP